MQAYGLYTHIRANRIRSGLLIAGLFLLVYVVTFAGALAVEGLSDDGLDAIAGRAAADMVVLVPLATIGAGLWLSIAWQFHQGLIGLVTGSKGVTREAEPRLYNLLENLCISRGVTMPKLSIMETDATNAFATGLNEKQYAITVTRGLLETLDDAEIEAVLAHELTHIRNRDVAVMVIAVVVAGVLSFFGEMVFRWLVNGPRRWDAPSAPRSDSNRKGGGAFAAILIALALIAAAWFLSLVIRFALSRSREFLADAGAVELTKNPDAMISALTKIQAKAELEAVPSGIMEMCVENPRSGFADLFATHPPVSERIEALVRFGGGRVPEQTPTAAGPWGAPDPAPPAAGSEPRV